MSEKRLFSFMCIEGMLMTVLGLCILILPKLTQLSFLIMVSVAFITYGVCKFVCSIVNRQFFKNFVCEILLGIYLIVIGILLSVVPNVDLYWLIALIGAYLVFETTSSTTFLVQARDRLRLNFWYLKLFVIAAIFASGLWILIKLPNMEFSTVAMIIGSIYLLKGNCKMTLAKLNKETGSEFENRQNNRIDRGFQGRIGDGFDRETYPNQEDEN